MVKLLQHDNNCGYYLLFVLMFIFSFSQIYIKSHTCRYKTITSGSLHKGSSHHPSVLYRVQYNITVWMCCIISTVGGAVPSKPGICDKIQSASLGKRGYFVGWKQPNSNPPVLQSTCSPLIWRHRLWNLEHDCSLLCSFHASNYSR